jgi:vacuolar-type H+-ATPase subunit C/Vma6
MKTTADRAYIYAKACGIIGTSFVGPRVRRLLEINRLSDLDRLLFPDAYEDLPERELLIHIEQKIIKRTIHQINSLVKTQQHIPQFITLLIRSYEYADIKLLISALLEKESSPPSHTDLGRFTTVRFNAYPDLKAMLSGTDFEWILAQVPTSQSENIRLQAELDRRYYSKLWEALQHTADPSIHFIKEIIAEEIRLKNVLWALRLKHYYQFETADIADFLLTIYDGKHSLVKAALSCVDKPIDQYASWSSFEYAALLNPEEPGTFWRLDIPYVQRKAALYLYKKARIFFRRSPFSLNTTACFIKLKQFEEDLLISLAEGISLGLSGREVLTMLEVLP